MSEVPFDEQGDPVLISEWDFHSSERERDITASLGCQHENWAEEEGRPNYFGVTEVFRVCEACGAAEPTGEHGSVF